MNNESCERPCGLLIPERCGKWIVLKDRYCFPFFDEKKTKKNIY